MPSLLTDCDGTSRPRRHPVSDGTDLSIEQRPGRPDRAPRQVDNE